jgi:hypothetical protein
MGLHLHLLRTGNGMLLSVSPLHVGRRSNPCQVTAHHRHRRSSGQAQAEAQGGGGPCRSPRAKAVDGPEGIRRDRHRDVCPPGANSNGGSGNNEGGRQEVEEAHRLAASERPLTQPGRGGGKPPSAHQRRGRGAHPRLDRAAWKGFLPTDSAEDPFSKMTGGPSGGTTVLRLRCLIGQGAPLSQHSSRSPASLSK